MQILLGQEKNNTFGSKSMGVYLSRAEDELDKGRGCLTAGTGGSEGVEGLTGEADEA